MVKWLLCERWLPAANADDHIDESESKVSTKQVDNFELMCTTRPYLTNCGKPLSLDALVNAVPNSWTAGRSVLTLLYLASDFAQTASEHYLGSLPVRLWSPRIGESNSSQSLDLLSEQLARGQ